jgi:hypothetical protein
MQKLKGENMTSQRQDKYGEFDVEYLDTLNRRELKAIGLLCFERLKEDIYKEHYESPGYGVDYFCDFGCSDEYSGLWNERQGSLCDKRGYCDTKFTPEEELAYFEKTYMTIEEFRLQSED